MNVVGVPSHLFRGSPAEVAASCRRHGLACVQLTPDFVGLRFREPAQITPERCRRAAQPFHDAGIRVAGLFAGAPLVDPDLDRRHRGVVRLHALIGRCLSFGTDRVILETGSLSPQSPWAPFPPNRSPEAWAELRLLAREALRVAADHGVTLLLKPESSQVLAGADDALRLGGELGHPRLRFVLDPAGSLLECAQGELDSQLKALVARAAPWTPLVHLKDLRFHPAGVATPRAGRGVLNYALLGRLLARHLPEAPVILEHLRPDEVAEAKAYVERCFAAAVY
jgi:sugar phosphate isomerase/epimerase